MDAQTLFREGVLALRDKKDVARARQLLTQSLKLDPKNEMAWLWLSRTTDDPQKKMQCVERALRLNPNNEQALALRAKLDGAKTPVTSNTANTPHIRHIGGAPPDTLGDLLAASTASADALDDLRSAAIESRSIASAPKIVSDQEAIATILAEADRRMEAQDEEGAIMQWVRVLDIQPDQPVAIQNAVRSLFKLGYKDDASELIERAIDSGTTSVPIYLTGIDLARVRGEPGKADHLREHVAGLPSADEALILKMADYFVESSQVMRAIDVLQKGLVTHPRSQSLLLRMGGLQEEALGNKAEAHRYYEQAARGGKGKGAQVAEKALSNFTPVLSDRERGSIGLALREALGFGVIFVLLGWQDAGLDLLRLGPQRWLGVGLSILGGYLLVTGLSAPQQKPLAAWLGGKVPAPQPPSANGEAIIGEPTALPIIPGVLRAMLALVGLIVLAGAFMLVFSMSIGLLRNPVQPYVPSIYDLLSE